LTKQEDLGSWSPIAADGSFTYLAWWAHGVYDVTTPYIYGFAWPSALGNCLPVLGEVGLPIPPRMFQQAGAWAVVSRVNPILLTITAAPAVGAVSGVTVAVSGLPAPAATFAIWWWFSEDGRALTGPLPSCPAAERGAPLQQSAAQAAAGIASALLPFDPELNRADSRFLTVARACCVPACAEAPPTPDHPPTHTHHHQPPAVLPAASTASAQNLCGENMLPLAGAPLPPGILGATLAWDSWDRAAASQSSAPLPPPSAAPPSPSTPAGPGPPSSPAILSASATATRSGADGGITIDVRASGDAPSASTALSAALLAALAALTGALWYE
jgi:hypothetical protein